MGEPAGARHDDYVGTWQTSEDHIYTITDTSLILARGDDSEADPPFPPAIRWLPGGGLCLQWKDSSLSASVRGGKLYWADGDVWIRHQEIPDGATICFVGIQSAPELNGRFARVLKYVRRNSTYHVEHRGETRIVARANIQHPCYCPRCSLEASDQSMCLECGYEYFAM